MDGETPYVLMVERVPMSVALLEYMGQVRTKRLDERLLGVVCCQREGRSLRRCAYRSGVFL